MERRVPGERIPLTGKQNIRDLGGYRTKDGMHVCLHKLIRSESLNGISEADKTILTGEYNLRRILDFRTLAEVKEKPDPVMEGVEYIHHPILSEAQMGMTHGEKEEGFGLLAFLVELLRNGSGGPEKFMSDLYAQLVTEEHTVAQYRRFFDYLLEQEEGAVLWHCSAGKDRAGTGAVLVLWALGVDEETIRQDYLLTNRYLKEELDQMIARLAVQVPEPEILEGVRIMNSACESYLNRLLDTAEEHYGSMDGFLERELGLCGERRELLRRKYLE